jgi:murein DD-endopeptidase MepM/ murein hydrolase activator NlpD
MLLSGNLGIKAQSFSCGFDFKTLQREGLNVHAVADGCVRIKISTFGMVKAFITHPNGYTSVYCHLQKGMPLSLY